MSELRTVIDAGRAFLDASANNPLVLADSRLPGRASQFLREIDVLYVQETEICVAIKRFGTENLLPGK